MTNAINRETNGVSNDNDVNAYMEQDLTLVEAVNLALSRAMSDDERVVILGEDVGANGGVFRATVGLQQQFGQQRVMDTPLAETLIAGSAIGMALHGLKTVTSASALWVLSGPDFKHQAHPVFAHVLGQL